ncbi:MAG: hypothetical protein OEZ24_05765 [Candidatus Bathyarchaeota archaeon]|nr:hypothetical protein [Candidatus Bathyarchaeota archaeon]
MLSDKIRIASFPEREMQYPRRHILFYRSYASFVKKSLRKSLFQRFLRWLLKRENIDRSLIKDVQIKTLPFQRENGNSLAGKWSRHGEISVFPKSLEFYRKLSARHGSDIARAYVKGRAWATLIHEILHAKYSSDEARVRRLTERYFSIYARNPKTEDIESVVFEILFKQ